MNPNLPISYMTRHSFSLLTTVVLFCALLFSISGCGESKREKRWRENRIRDSLATIAQLDSAFQEQELTLDTLFGAMNKVQKLGAADGAFDYEPQKTWGNLEWQLRGFTGFFVPKNSDLKTSEIKDVLELEFKVYPNGKASLSRPQAAREGSGDHVAEALFLVKDRRQTGHWSEAARKDQKREVLAFFEKLPKCSHIRLQQSIRNIPPKLSGTVFEPGEIEKRYFFFDIRKSEIVGHYYVTGTNSMSLYVYGNTGRQELEKDLEKNFHNNELDAANKLTSSLVPPYL